MEEELFNVDSTFFHYCPYVFQFHFLQLLLHCSHALTLERNVIILGIDFLFLGQTLWILRLQEMYSNSVSKQPCPIKVKWSRSPDWSKPKNILIKVHGFLNWSTHKGDVVQRFEVKRVSHTFLHFLFFANHKDKRFRLCMNRRKI